MNFHNLIKTILTYGLLVLLSGKAIAADERLFSCDKPMLEAISCNSLFTLSMIMVTFARTTHMSENLSQKIVLAKADALGYIATEGTNYHSAYLGAAFQAIRYYHPKASNLQLAQMIAIF